MNATPSGYITHRRTRSSSTTSGECERQAMIKGLIRSLRYREDAASALKIVTQLSKRETVQHFIRSLQSEASWTKSNIFMNKRLGKKPMKSKHVIFQARKEERMKSAVYEQTMFAIPSSKDNADEVCLSSESEDDETEESAVAFVTEPFWTWRCSPLEALVRSLEDEYNYGSVHSRSLFGTSTLLLSFAHDKYADGTAYTLLWDIKEKNNNDPWRRRPMAWLPAPVKDSVSNMA